MTDNDSHNPSAKHINSVAIRAGVWLLTNKHVLATVESCTGGGIAQAVTQVPGSSIWFERGFVTYSNLAKQQQVNVDEQLIQTHGAVSEQVAGAMASGGLVNSEATLCLSVTGIAGPEGGSDEKPVGTVCFGRAQANSVVTITKHFDGNREQIRNQSIIFALSACLFQSLQ